MKKRLLIFYNRIREQLWFRPFIFCLISVAGALIAQLADGLEIQDLVPDIGKESIGGLLNTISASMLVIAIFAVASMLAAFSSASSTATPRSFKIVVTDDVSQNALSIFIGAFIFSIVGTIALDNGFYQKSGRFVLFLFTLILFAIVILTFLRWVDRISRLGRLEHTINQVERVAEKSLMEYINHPFLWANPIRGDLQGGNSVYSDSTGYIRNFNLEDLQSLAAEKDLTIRINYLPGKFVHPNSELVQYRSKQNVDRNEVEKRILKCIHIGATRLFDEDPRFGIISLTEIASRALSPGINDPGTAIQIIGSHERLFHLWNKKEEKQRKKDLRYDRIEVSDISMIDFVSDAFRPIARDGADNIEVMLRLQKALVSLNSIDHPLLQAAVHSHSMEAFERAKLAMNYEPDLNLLKARCLFYKS